ncbi:hypothetical protein CJI59_16720 [Streptomyces sp. Alain-F2R5]|nr:MarR family transcriptional regulator [Streptomyces sp. Alain-F2R5]PAN00528.1 hypothetical protein CJI59_16720 [Streptomyces sp. Alain-F2R5]
MTRLHSEPVASEEIYKALSTADLVHSAKVVWVLLRISSDPLSQKAIAEAIHMDVTTVARLVRTLESNGMARKIHGVWLAESPSPKEGSR